MPIIFWISYSLIIITLAALAYRDAKEYILPNVLNLNLAILMFIVHFSNNFELLTPMDMLKGSLIGGGFVLAIKFAADKFYNQDSLGLGDVKLIFAAGIGLGFPNIFIALSLGSFIGVIQGIILAHRNKTPVAESQIPAGIGLSIAIGIILSYDIYSIINL